MDTAGRVRSIVKPVVGVIGVRDREEGPENSPDLSSGVGFPSPSRTRVSIDFSRLPLSPFKTAKFLFSSVNPISLSLLSFESKSALPSDPTAVPNTLDCLFLLGDGDLLLAGSGLLGSGTCLAAASFLAFEESGKIELADRKPNLLPVLGGKGGGLSSEFVLPVSCLFGALIDLSWYFCLMNLSIAISASSASTGMGGFAFCGLNILFDATFPIRLIVCF